MCIRDRAGAASEQPDTWAKETAAQPSEAVHPVEEPKPEPKTELKNEPKGPSTYETAKITRVTSEHTAAGARRTRPSGAPSSDAVAGKIGQMPQREQPNPLSALISERAKAEAEKPAQQEKPAEPAKPAQPEPETPEHVGRHEQPAKESTGGRRRRDAGREGTLTVAELIARSKRS